MICLSLADIPYAQCLEIVKNEPLAEIRIDRLDMTIDQLNVLFSSGKSLIATCRQGRLSERERLERLEKAIAAGAAYVDIEVESDIAYRETLLDAAEKYGCQVIISYHNFDSTPDMDELNVILRQCFNYNADIAKIVTTINSHADKAKILSLYAKELNVVAFGMGAEGKITRVMAPFMGAPFTYVSLSRGKETAPGQICKEEMQRIIDLLS